MRNNIGKTDKVVRVLFALVLLALYYGEVVSGLIAVIALSAAVVLLLTSLVNFCPLYRIFNINSIKKAK